MCLGAPDITLPSQEETTPISFDMGNLDERTRGLAMARNGLSSLTAIGVPEDALGFNERGFGGFPSAPLATGGIGYSGYLTGLRPGQVVSEGRTVDFRSTLPAPNSNIVTQEELNEGVLGITEEESNSGVIGRTPDGRPLYEDIGVNQDRPSFRLREPEEGEDPAAWDISERYVAPEQEGTAGQIRDRGIRLDLDPADNFLDQATFTPAEPPAGQESAPTPPTSNSQQPPSYVVEVPGLVTDAPVALNDGRGVAIPVPSQGGENDLVTAEEFLDFWNTPVYEQEGYPQAPENVGPGGPGSRDAVVNERLQTPGGMVEMRIDARENREVVREENPRQPTGGTVGGGSRRSGVR